VRSERKARTGCPWWGSSLFSGHALAQGCLQIDLVFLLVYQNSANVLGYCIFSHGLTLAKPITANGLVLIVQIAKQVLGLVRGFNRESGDSWHASKIVDLFGD